MIVQVLDDFLESELFDEINELSVACYDLSFWKSTGNWQDTLNTGTNDVLMYTIYNSKTELKVYEDITSPINEKFKKEFNLNLSNLEFFYWKKGSLINFHPDFTYLASATLYLNEFWHRDWGGIFLWDEEENVNPLHHPEDDSGNENINRFKGALPLKNRCIINSGRVQHAVTPTKNHPDDVVRRTLQMRFR